MTKSERAEIKAQAPVKYGKHRCALCGKTVLEHPVKLDAARMVLYTAARTRAFVFCQLHYPVVEAFLEMSGMFKAA